MRKLIDSYFIKETGISSVTIETELGYFHGLAWLHPDDKEYASEFTGCAIAEYRATYDYLLVKLNKLNIELNTLYNLTKYIKNNSFINKKIKEKELYKKQLKKDLKNLKYLSDNLFDIKMKNLKKLKKQQKED